MAKKVSEYAERLRALGFREEPSMLTRAERRKVLRDSRRGLLKPTYSPYDYGPLKSFTLCTDETGQWRANRIVDLSIFGFRNNIDWFSSSKPDTSH